MENTKTDTTLNVTNLLKEAVVRIDDLRDAEIKRVDEKFKDGDIKYQVQFTAAKEAVAIASTAQEKLVAQALDGTKEAITKNDANTDKRFDLLSEKINAIAETINKNTGAQGIYVTHNDLSIFGEKLQTSFEEALKPLISQVNTLTNAQNNQQGRSGGANSLWGYIAGGLGALATILAIFSYISK